jgi:hypothetical protein
MGVGHYLSPAESKALFQELREKSDSNFKELYYKELGETISALISFDLQPIKIDVIEFIATENIFYKPSNPDDTLTYLITFNGMEGLPDSAKKDRLSNSNGFYDIYVISGHYLQFDKSKKNGTFKFVRAGAAE